MSYDEYPGPGLTVDDEEPGQEPPRKTHELNLMGFGLVIESGKPSPPAPPPDWGIPGWTTEDARHAYTEHIRRCGVCAAFSRDVLVRIGLPTDEIENLLYPPQPSKP